MNAATGSLLTEADAEVPDSLDERLVAIKQLLDARRAQTFPIEGLAAPVGHTWTSFAGTTWQSIEEFHAQRSESRRGDTAAGGVVRPSVEDSSDCWCHRTD